MLKNTTATDRILYIYQLQEEFERNHREYPLERIYDTTHVNYGLPLLPSLTCGFDWYHSFEGIKFWRKILSKIILL